MSYPEVTFALPSWLDEWLQGKELTIPDREQRMTLVVELSRKNIEQGTGGPFSAAVFDMETHRLVAPGLNLVTSSGCSIAHAEMMAITFAQKVVGSYSLDLPDHPGYELVSSTQPCAMCLGAIPWSGVRALVYGASEEDAERAGFDEGDKVDDWVQRLEQRGIEVVADVCREEAAAVIKGYAAKGGVIY